jgi:hypothetical protein
MVYAVNFSSHLGMRAVKKMNDKKEIKKITIFIFAVNEHQTREECKFASNIFVKYMYSTGVHL